MSQVTTPAPATIEITFTAEQASDLIDEIAVLVGATAIDTSQTPTVNKLSNTLIHELQQLTGVRKVMVRR
ncbi:hypothetical protein [Candidatus Nitrospira bockiana]